MRGQWDHEQPLSPSLLRSALALLGGFLALSALIMLIIALASVAARNYFAGALQFSVGIALPFAIWLGLKMLADILVVLNRSHDKLEIVAEKLGRGTQPAPRTPSAQTPSAKRAGDDGPVYQAEK